jgi:predicted TIM-barrel fold metal-dependent hydrolase
VIFFDSNACIGTPSVRALHEAPSAESLLVAMDEAGIEKALVWHVAQHDLDPLAGNKLLSESVRGHDRLVGTWTMLPTQCGEIPAAERWVGDLLDAGVRAVRMFPTRNRYLPRREVIGDVLDILSERRVPLLLSLRLGPKWPEIYDLLKEFPKLTVVLCDLDIWPADRFFRPLLNLYSGAHIETSTYLADGGIEAFVRSYGSRRILFGSGFPKSYPGGAMLALRHAEIDDDDKLAIAGDNLQRLLSEVRT